MSKKINDGFDPFDFKDLDEMIKKLFGNIGNLPNLGETNPNTHHRSITYRFGTGMDKPEIRINGEEVDNDTINDVFKNHGLNSNKNIPKLDVKDIADTIVSSTPQYEDPYFEVEKDGNSTILTIELPNVDKDHIFISQIGKKITIIGENDYTAYKAEFENEATIDKTKTNIVGNNSIYQIKWT